MFDDYNDDVMKQVAREQWHHIERQGEWAGPLRDDIAWDDAISERADHIEQ